MAWLDLVENPKPITSTFGDRPPEIDVVRVLEVVLDRRTRRLQLRFETDDSPDNPPKRWEGANTTQIALVFDNVYDVRITGWTDRQAGQLLLRQSDTTICADFANEDYEIHVESESCRLEYVSAYILDAP